MWLFMVNSKLAKGTLSVIGSEWNVNSFKASGYRVLKFIRYYRISFSNNYPPLDSNVRSPPIFVFTEFVTLSIYILTPYPTNINNAFNSIKIKVNSLVYY